MTIAERLRFNKPDQLTAEEAHRSAEDLSQPHPRIPRDVLIVVFLALSSSASFGLGLLAGREQGEGQGGNDFWVERLRQQPAAVSTTTATIHVENTEQSEPAAPAAGGTYVASKSGEKYYFPWCGTVSRIKEENKIWFASKAEVEAAGYEPAKNCKGL